MFDYDKWQEIFGTIRKNKLRTFLTIFGIGWGIFMIVILLGAGKGLENGVTRDFGTWATNSGFIWGRRTTISHEGFKPGRFVRFNNQDTEYLRRRIKDLRYLAPRNQLGGWQGGFNVRRDNKTGQFNVYGDYPEYNLIQRMEVYRGRFINKLDINDERKVAVIGQNVADVLFPEDDDDPMGQYIQINKVNFMVVGIFKSIRTGEDADRDTQTIYIPFTTFQKAFKYGDRVGWYAYMAQEGVVVSDLESQILGILRERHDVHPKDEDAIGHFNLEEEYQEISGLFSGMNFFTWFVGISTLFAGIIGVSNIMLIIVKERTKEIGIRKSLGATPASIISLIIQESIFLTTVGGYFALVIGVLILEGIGSAMGEGDGFMGAPEIDITVALGALGILIVGGGLAGILPSSRAVSIKPIEAIRQE